jgi:hypothetical protein
VLVEDILQMSGAHEIELFFHCSEQCHVNPVPGGYRIGQAENTLFLQLPEAKGAASGVHYGSTAPILGWVSRRFDEKQPAPTIAWRARLAGDVVLRSEVIC